MGQRRCPNCPGPSASLGGEGGGGKGYAAGDRWGRWGVYLKRAPRGFPAQMQMRHGTNYLIGMK